MKSIKTKLIAIYAAVVLVVMTASGTFMLYDMRNMEIVRTETQLRGHADSINTAIVQIYDPAQFSTASWWDMLGQSEYDIQIMIMNDIGIPIAPLTYVGADLRFNERALMAAVYGQEGFSVGRTGTDLDGVEQQWIVLAMPVFRDGEKFIIYARANTQFMYESLSRHAMTLVIMILIALVLTVVFWFFLANTITNPIRTLTRHAKSIAAGDLNREIVIKNNDEIGQLGYNFNFMARELQSTISSLVSEKNKSEVILQNTSHGVLAYDAGGNLIHANNASSDLLPNIGNHVGETLTTLGFDPREIYMLKPGEIKESTYEEGENAIFACATTYTSETGKIDGYIIVLQDVTRQTKLDNMRKEFVANVSHELRTPLTSIRTYTETLLEGALDDKQTAEKFIKVVNDEAQRMSLLVTDLLELSRIDSSTVALEMDVVDIVALLRLTIRQSQFMADQKDQTIEVAPLPSSCFIEANASRINQVISNILSNSMKYSPENTMIHVALEVTEKYCRLFIKDQGIGIPQESLGRIFERFYRVDKARARAMGGTGLGLAIVKEIMEEHGGKVHASSQVGQGTTMVLRFNRCE